MTNKYIFLHLETLDGEREYDHKSVHQLSYKEDTIKWADNYCSDFWMGQPGEKNEYGYYEFYAGSLATRVVEVRNISKEHYKILKNYI